MGQGTVVAAAKSVATAAAADRFTVSYLANGATPSIAIVSPKPMQKKDREDFQREMKEKKSGARNAGSHMLLEGGLDVKVLSHEPQKMQLIEARNFSVEEIARYFGVPLHFLASPQGSQGYGRNLSELGHALINFGLTPWTKRLEQEAQIKLIPNRTPKTTVIDLSYLSRGTEKETAEADEIRIRSGVFTINECRENLGANHGPADCDEHLILTTMQPLEKALAPPPPPATLGVPQAPNIPQPGGGEDPESDPTEGGQGGVAPPSEAAARTASVLLAKALADHARRWRARKADLERSSPAAQLPRYLDHARAELRGKVGLDAAELCEAVENGADPVHIAHQYLGQESAP